MRIPTEESILNLFHVVDKVLGNLMVQVKPYFVSHSIEAESLTEHAKEKMQGLIEAWRFVMHFLNGRDDMNATKFDQVWRYFTPQTAAVLQSLTTQGQREAPKMTPIDKGTKLLKVTS